MKTYAQPLTVSGIIHREQSIDPSPPFQRGPVWTRKQKQLLVDTILRKYDIPKIYLWDNNDGHQFKYRIVDGQQRLRTIWEFKRGQYPLDKDMDPIQLDSQMFLVGGRNYADLPEELKDGFDQYELSIVHLVDASEDEVEDMFLRLQNGTPLNAAEKRNAISGKMRDFVHKALAIHSFWDSVDFDNKRFAYDSVAAQMVRVELQEGPCNVKGRDLEQMYRDGRDFDQTNSTAKRVVRVLDFLAKAFSNREPAIELNKATCLSLFLIVSHLTEHFAIKTQEGRFSQWFGAFEKQRVMDEQKAEDERDPYWVEYQNKTSHSTDGLDSLEYRRKFLLEQFLAYAPDLELLDDQRIFTLEQRRAIWYRDGGKCQNCGLKVSWDNYEADHKKPWSLGGKTTVENGQVLCKKCNAKKGGKALIPVTEESLGAKGSPRSVKA